MSATIAADRERDPRWWEGDLVFDFLHSPVALVAAALTLVIVAAALGADLIAPYDANDPAAANVIDARLPPGSVGLLGGRYLLGTDPQGRDMLSAIIYGLRSSLVVGLASVLIAATVGTALGLLCGYFGGIVDAVIMRIADVQLGFPAILIALLIDGVTRTVLPRGTHDAFAVPVLIVAIAASFWPNVMGPVLVIATINLALAILTEATLSFLGVGVPPTQPSLGSLVRIGNEFLFSGDWWISIFPGAMLVVLCLSVNLFGDFLRDALDPKLRIG
jgi:peptide/nickel transport system permease protein